MDVNRYIRKFFGSRFPRELNEDALRQYCRTKGIDTKIIEEIKQMDFDYDQCARLRGIVKTSSEWRQLALCYAAVAYQHILDEKICVSEIGMGIIKSPFKTDIPNYHDKYSQVFGVYVDRTHCEATKGFGSYINHIRARIQPNPAMWQKDALETLAIISESAADEERCLQMPRFDLSEMGVVEDGYLSFFYKLKFGRYVFVFHTTERGFDVFSLLRFILHDVMPESVVEFLGENAQTVS